MCTHVGDFVIKMATHKCIEKEKEEDGDTIRGTVYSKSWVLSLLVKLINTVEFTTEGEKEERNNELSLNNEGQTEGGELDERIENDLCLLWDVSVTSVR